MKNRVHFRSHNARRVLAFVMSMIFIVMIAAETVSAVAIKLPSHKVIAEAVADEGTVLLKNDGVLPLKSTDKVVGMGNQTYAYSLQTPPAITDSGVGFAPPSMVLGGLGSGKVYTDSYVSYKDGLTNAASKGLIASYTAITDAASASSGNKAIYFINRLTSEANDTPESYYYLLDAEKTAITSLISKVGKDNVIIVLNVGGVIDTTWLISQDVGAIVCAYYGGEMAGTSLANILTGKVTPSGKTVDTWAKSYSYYPAVSVGTTGGKNVSRYTEDIYTGYRYFETFDPSYEKVNYEFGYGLSYTSFAFSNRSVTVNANGEVTATVTVTNVGAYSGKEVVQVYVDAPDTLLDNPSKELVGFKKTDLLAPDESQTVTVTFELSDAADFDDLGKYKKNAWILQGGNYDFYIGNSIKNAGKGGVVSTYEKASTEIVKEVSTSLDTLLYERLTADGNFEILNGVAPSNTVNAYGSTVIQAESYDRSGYESTRSETFYQGALGGTGVGYLGNASAYVEYDLVVEKAGNYNIAFAISATAAASDILTVYVNGTEQTAVVVDITATHTADDRLWHQCTYINSKSNVIYLPAGEVTLKIASNGAKLGNMDFFEIYNADISSSAETTIEAENFSSTNLGTPYGHYPDGMATGRSSASGTTYTFVVNAETAGKYYLAINASNTVAASTNAAKITVNDADVTEKISLVRSAYGGANGLSNGTSYPIITQFMKNGNSSINYNGNSDDYMFVRTDDVAIDLVKGSNTIVITTMDASLTRMDKVYIRPSSIGAANVGTYVDNTSAFEGTLPTAGEVLSSLITFGDVVADGTLMDAFLSQFSIDDLLAISHLQASGEGNINSSTGAVGGNSSTYGKVNSKFEVPLSNTSDGPAGIRMNNAQSTWFPCMTMLASTYNSELAEEVGKAAGTEANNGDITMWLAPGINIHRDPLCGRNFEYFSEDPIVTAVMAGSVVRGVQSKGVSACIKHYFANNQEANRHAYDAHISARAIREIYVKAFEIIVENDNPWAIMSSYNLVNGDYVATSEDLINGIIRDDWGYEGLVIGDWGTGYDHLSSLKAGNNVKSMYPHLEIMKAAYNSRLLTREELENNAEHVINYLITIEKSKNAVCYIGNEGYTNLQSAVDAVKSGETIRLVSDIELADSVVIPNKDLTFTIDGSNGNEKFEIFGRKYLFDCLGRANVTFSNLIITSSFTGIRLDPNEVLSNGSTALANGTLRTINFNNCDVTFNDLGFKVSGLGATNLGGYVMNFNGCTLTQNTTERLFYITSVSNITINLNDTDVIENGRGSNVEKGLFQIDNNVTAIVNVDKDSYICAAPSVYKEDTAGGKYAEHYAFMLRGNGGSLTVNLDEGARIHIGGTVDTANYHFVYVEDASGVLKVTDKGGVWTADETAARAGVKLPAINNADALSLGWTSGGVLYGAGYKNTEASGIVTFKPVYISKSGFDMEDGAAIRYTDDGGIRFTTYLSEEVREQLGENAVFGTLIAPKALLKGDLTIENVEANGFANIVAKRFAMKDGKRVYYAALIGFPDTTAAYRTTFAARSYVTLTYDDGSTNTIYTDFDDENIRSCYEVANNLYNRVDSPITDNEYINNVIEKSETCSPHYGVSYKNGSTTYSKCKFCNTLIDAPTTIDISGGKYANKFDLFITGEDIDVTYTFTNVVTGTNAAWHNFIIDIQPAVAFSDGSVYGLNPTSVSKYPILPYYSEAYYNNVNNSQSRHEGLFPEGYGITFTHLGSQGLLTKDGADITDYAKFKSYMSEGLDVTVHITREDYGPVIMKVDYVTKTSGCYGQINASYGYEGYKNLNLSVTGEYCKLNDFKVTIEKGEQIKAGSVGTSVIGNGIPSGGSALNNGNMVISNIGSSVVSNVYGAKAEYRFKGDYEIELEFVMSSSWAQSAVHVDGWDTWCMNFYANSDSIWDNDYQICGNGVEKGTLNHGHTNAQINAWNDELGLPDERKLNLVNTKFSSLTPVSGYDETTAVYGATVTMRISRFNGYTTVSGVTKKDGVVTGYYSFYSKDVTYVDTGSGKLWNGGKQDYPTTIRFYCEDSVMTINKLNLISGENYK